MPVSDDEEWSVERSEAEDSPLLSLADMHRYLSVPQSVTYSKLIRNVMLQFDKIANVDSMSDIEILVRFAFKRGYEVGRDSYSS